MKAALQKLLRFPNVRDRTGLPRFNDLAPQLVPPIQRADALFATAASVQWRARSHGIAGIYGTRGNVESATYRI
jgi:hypothetical protein